MDYRALAVLLIRVAGLVAIVSALNASAASLARLFDPKGLAEVGSLWLATVVIVPVVLPLVLGLVMIYFPATIVSGVLRIDGFDNVSESNIQPLQRVAFSAFGLYLIVYSVLDSMFIYSRVRLYHMLIDSQPVSVKMPPLLPDDFAGLVTTAIQFVLGICILFGNRGLSNVIARDLGT